jgi:hypothetical protein
MTDLLATGNVGRRRMRIAGQMLGSLLLGGVAILGSILIFRQGMLPLIEAAFHPGPELTQCLQTRRHPFDGRDELLGFRALA